MLRFRTKRLVTLASLLFSGTLLLPLSAQKAQLAPTPPMGWNSWDSYGTTINEQNFRSSAEWVAAHLKPAGYEYVTIDEAWFDDNPPADGSAPKTPHLLDQYGRYIPSPNRFPSAANGMGFTPLADYIHSLGLKFGIHVLQGIPKLGVASNFPVEGSAFHAKDAANIASGCQWNTDNWDLQENPAGQAYYDSIVKLYASWHVDLIKIDCIASRPYKGEEIRMFHEAITKSGRAMVLSLSPGPAPLDEAENLRAYAQQWRISDDVWDVWESKGTFPQGVNDQITRAPEWVPWAGRGVWPDLDMMPLGELRPAPGWGEARRTRLTKGEQRSMMDLWAIVRSPLVYGGNPVQTDAATLALLTNPRIIAVDQHSHGNEAILLSPDLAIYRAVPDSGPGTYVAVFNRKATAEKITLPWSKLGIAEPTTAHPYKVTDLWTDRETSGVDANLFLGAHDSTILLVQ